MVATQAELYERIEQMDLQRGTGLQDGCYLVVR